MTSTLPELRSQMELRAGLLLALALLSNACTPLTPPPAAGGRWWSRP